LETSYDSQDYTDVGSDNGVRVDANAEAESEYVLHQFKDYVGTETACEVNCNLQSNVPTSTSTVYLQVYNYDSPAWETKDSESTVGADTDFDLTFRITDLTDYKSPGGYMTWRVYQQDA
jgi:hypothetical protein